MTDGARSGAHRPPKRKLRNFLLDTRFQLKYTGYVVGVALLLSGILGYVAIDFSRESSKTLAACNMLAYGDQPDVLRFIEEESRKFDAKVAWTIVGSLTAFVVALALTGIVVTHKVVGPAFKLRRLMREVGDGSLRVEGRLRRGDELQSVFDGFDYMLKRQRELRGEDLKLIEAALESLAGEEPDREAARRALHHLRDRIAASIEGKPSESSASRPVPVLPDSTTAS